METRSSLFHRLLPGLTLVLLAPLMAELLPGATRLSSAFVFPIEMGVWGIGALFIREAVRRLGLGWRNMLLLALALAMAEEFWIQQSSLAPLVVNLAKGPDYARAGGVNWLYLIWALGYETVFVVLLPVALAELIFPARRTQGWVNRGGAIFGAVYFALAAFLAWFTWTKIARPKVFHLPAYVPPAITIAIGAGIILALLVLALGPVRRLLASSSAPLSAPRPWLVFLLSLIPPVLWFGLMLLAFDIRPNVPPLAAAIGGITLAGLLLAVVPRWVAGPAWRDSHTYAAVLGVTIANFGIFFLGFIGALPLDLYGKIVLDAAALLLLIALGRKVAQR